RFYSQIAVWTFNAMAILCNWALVSSSVLIPPKDESSLRIFKEPSNEFEYVAKRHGIDVRKEDADSKERRSSMSSSFIRFGRSQSAFNTDNSDFDSEADSKVSRYPRWKSPDIVIRFGRSSFKTANVEQLKRGRNDNFIRFGRNIQIAPADVDLSTVCSALTLNGVSSDAELHPDGLRLLHLCNSLNKIAGEISLDTFEDQAVSRHRE
ncbi:hypothetical protein DMN91_011399, partial [Ooceraea biroi]